VNVLSISDVDDDDKGEEEEEEEEEENERMKAIDVNLSFPCNILAICAASTHVHYAESWIRLIPPHKLLSISYMCS
jgi:hypothetical protein